jgi:uncharacterized membrane protein
MRQIGNHQAGEARHAQRYAMSHGPLIERTVTVIVKSVRTGAMPPGNVTRITPEERDLLRRWIAQGAAVD